MTITNTANSVTALGNGATTSFAFTFLIPDAASAQVFLTASTGLRTALTQGVEYSISGLGSGGGGTVTYPLVGSPLASPNTITIRRVVSPTQLTDYTNQDGSYADVIEASLDKITEVAQQLTNQGSEFSRATFVPQVAAPSAPGIGSIYWDASLGALLAWNGTAWVVLSSPSGTSISFSGPYGPTTPQFPNQSTGEIYYDNTGVYAEHGSAFNLNVDNGATAPPGLIPAATITALGRGDNATFIGTTGLRLEAKDRAGVGVGTKGVLYGAFVAASPSIARSNSPADDAVGIVIVNGGSAKGTEALYIGTLGTIVGKEWQSAIGINAASDWAIRVVGSYTDGIDLTGAAFTGSSIKVPDVDIIAPAGNTPALNILQATASGTVTNPTLNSIAIADSIDAGSSTVDGVAIYHGFGTSTAKGARQALQVQVDLTSATAATNANRNYVGLDAIAKASVSDGGGVGTEKGSFFAVNPVVWLTASATNIAEASGGEVNTQCLTGSTVLDKYGWKVVQVSNDAVAGSRNDAALQFDNQAGAVGWGTLIQIGDGLNASPLKTTGAVMSTKGSPTFAFGIDFAGATCTNFSFRAQNFTVNPDGMVAGSAQDNITAHAGGGQAAAFLLSKVVNRVATVASANDSVKLPVSAPGMQIFLVNGAAVNSMQVFGSGTDTINDVATATGVAQAAGKSATYACPVAGKWYRVLSA